MNKLAVIVLSMLLLAACGSSTSAHYQNGSPTADPAAPPGNFMYSRSTEAMFLAWVNTNGDLPNLTEEEELPHHN